MKFAIGDDIGQLKIITAPRGTDTSLKTSVRPFISTYFTPDRKDPVYAVCKIDKYQGEERAGLVAVIFTSGKVKLVDTSVSPISGEEKYLLYTGSSPVPSTTATTSPVISAGIQHGILYLFRADGEVKFYRFDGESSSVKTMSFPGKVAAGAVFTEALVNGWPSAIAIGGEKRDLEVFEPTVEEGDWGSVWKAKNVRQDKLGLEVPVYIRRILFLGAGEGGEAAGNKTAAHPRGQTTVQTSSRKYRLATGTHHSHLRIYDTAVSRHPIFTTTLTKFPILSLHLHPSTQSPTSTPLTVPNTPPESSTTSSPHNWIYTDSNGHFALYDSATRREVGIYKGSTGAVNATATFSKDVVAGVGFDRYLRVYEGARREVVKAYVRSKGTAVVVLDGEDEVVEVEKSQEEEEEEVWGEMEEVVGLGIGEGGGGDEGDFTEALVKVRRRRPRTDKEGGGSKKRRVEV